MNNEAPSYSGQKPYTGIGGWLIFVIISLVITPIIAFVYLTKELFPLKDSLAWSFLTLEEPLLKPLFYFEAVFNILLIFIPIILLVLLFKKSKIYPKAMIIYLVSFFIIHIIDIIFAAIVFGNLGVYDEVSSEIYRSLAKVLLTTGIWVPYFLVSKRVKATFLGEEVPMYSTEKKPITGKDKIIAVIFFLIGFLVVHWLLNR